MKKTIFTLFSFAFTLPFLFLLPQQAHASGEILGTWDLSSVKFCGSPNTNCDSSHLTATDSATYTTFSASANGAYVQFYPDISVGTNLNSITLNYQTWVSNPSSVNSSACNTLYIRWYDSGGTPKATATDASSGCGGSMSFSSTPQDVSYTLFPSAATSWASGDYLSISYGICNGTGCSSQYINDIQSNHYFFTPKPTISISSVVASQSANTVTFNISGDTQYTQVGEQCKISLDQFDISNPSQPVLVTSDMASILLDANNPRTTTGKQSQSVYLGYGFTSTVSTWEADGITVPLFNTKNTDIRGHVNCWHMTDNADGSQSVTTDIQQQGFDQSLLNYNSSLLATPSALQNQPASVQPDCTGDWICSVEQWFYSSMSYIFGFNPAISADEFSSLQSDFLGKAPFAYIDAAYGASFAATATSSAVPNVSLGFSNSGGNSYDAGTIPGISFSDSGGIVASFATAFRDLMQILVWFSFLWYVIGRIKSIFI